MGGWTGEGKDGIIWDGWIKAKQFIGDGSLLTGITSIPSGTIALWNGTIATIPTGWFLCNGSNGTPDLRNLFIVGAQEDSGGIAKTNVTGSLTQTGGSNSHLHDLGTHSHSYGTLATSAHASHTHLVSGNTGYPPLPCGGCGGGNPLAPCAHCHSVSITSQGCVVTAHTISGSTGTCNNNTGACPTLPPYYALAYIMKT